MYGSAASTRVARGRSTPEILAISLVSSYARAERLALALLVLRIRADHTDNSVAPNHFAFVAASLYGCSNFHRMSNFPVLARGRAVRPRIAMLNSPDAPRAHAWRVRKTDNHTTPATRFVRISGGPLRIKTVCSKWADRR